MSDDFFGDVFKDFWKDGSFKVDVKETEKEYSIHADLPGFKKEEIQIDYDCDVLTIRAEHTESSEENTEDFLRRERTTASQYRQFILKNVEEDKIKAAYKDGVLTIDLPKAADNDTSKKKISIE